MIDLRSLTRQFATTGTLQGIWLRPGRELPAQEAQSCEALAGRGLQGDRSALSASRSPGGSKRQVTLLQAEHLPLIAAWTRREHVSPSLLRRNLVISGINLIGMRSPFADQVLRLGIGSQVIVELTGPCDPVRRWHRSWAPAATTHCADTAA